MKNLLSTRSPRLGQESLSHRWLSPWHPALFASRATNAPEVQRAGKWKKKKNPNHVNVWLSSLLELWLTFDEEPLSVFWLSQASPVASPNDDPRCFLLVPLSALQMLGADSWQNIFSLKHLISECFGSSSPQIRQLTGNLAAIALY